ncbi:AAA family ATPase [Nocardia farcinica]
MSVSSTTRRWLERPRVIEWAVRNFKAVEHASLPLLPLNLLLGPNSSGKSSLLQTLLILGQSTEDEIVLNGPLVRLGTAADVIRSGSNSTTFGFVARERESRESRKSREVCEILFEITMINQAGSLVPSEFIAVDQKSGTVILRATSERVAKAAQSNLSQDVRPHEIFLRICEIDDKPAPPFTYLALSGFTPTAIGFRRTKKDVRNELRRSVKVQSDILDSEQAFETYFQIAEWLTRSGRDLAQKSLPVEPPSRGRKQQAAETSRRGAALENLLTISASELRSVLDSYVDSQFGDTEWVRYPVYFGQASSPRISSGSVFPPPSPRIQSALATSSFGAEALRLLQVNLRYLGPLREEPQVVSPTGPRSRSLPVGPKGEYTADLLARSKDTRVRYFDWNDEPSWHLLPVALTRWVKYLGLGDSVTVEDQGRLGRGLRIRLNGAERDLTMIGVGASQLVPVLLAVLTAAPGSIILLEQPELHLHPSVQSRLADFFLKAKRDVRLIVETHSEYLVSRIRRRVVEEPTLSTRVAVLFAEQVEGATEVRQLQIDRLGDFSAWPTGFFDTQDHESMELALAVRRALSSGNQS